MEFAENYKVSEKCHLTVIMGNVPNFIQQSHHRDLRYYIFKKSLNSCSKVSQLLIYLYEYMNLSPINNAAVKNL